MSFTTLGSTGLKISRLMLAFVGVGLATSRLEAGESETAYGSATLAGVYYWMDRHFALAFEGEYNLLLSPETAHEFVLASGGALRF